MTNPEVHSALKAIWGYSQFLPLQEEAVAADLSQRDSLVVLPTGGGKSLCYQLPAIISSGWTLVISPLISLMKDQVDQMRALGIAAAALNSASSGRERAEVANRLTAGQLKILYISPERFVTEQTLHFLQAHPPRSIVIDEAHCISSWGHDFRPEYRSLAGIRSKLPDAGWHAFTATATPKVQEDIIEQLQLRDPAILIGDFFRPNLVYYARRRSRGLNQICDVLERYGNDCGIIYAISRQRVEELSNLLNELGYRTLPYHAGLTDDQRTANQEALVNDRIQAIVATVAFGMGINKPNLRYVIHAELPRSIENYQQESGRAGRDGLPAECWLLYSGQDFLTWRRIFESSNDETEERGKRALQVMQSYCASFRCRHQFLVQHFGQHFEKKCQSCDVCLGLFPKVQNSLTLARMILSCVVRVKQRFGAHHVAKVLVGSKDRKILQMQHDKLSTWGLLKSHRIEQVRDWLDQLVAQCFLTCLDKEFSLLQVTPSGQQLLFHDAEVTLFETIGSEDSERELTQKSIIDSWEGVDRRLFEHLASWRRAKASLLKVPAFVVFSDVTLRDLARRRPTSSEGLLKVHGIGEKKRRDFGSEVIELIFNYCQKHSLDANVIPSPETATSSRGASGTPTISASALEAFHLFRAGVAIEAIAEKLDRAISTVNDYLLLFIANDRITDATRWVDPIEISRIELAADYLDGTQRLKPLFEALHGMVSYDHIRIVLACRAQRQALTARA